MSCSVHEEREHVGTCSECGRFLCQECLDRFNPPACPNCVGIWGKKVKGQLAKMIVASVILTALGITVMHPSGGFLPTVVGTIWFACIPWGWSGLTKITPKIFLFLPLVGWVIYFLIKLVIAFFIGPIAAPFQILKYVRNLKLAKTAYET